MDIFTRLIMLLIFLLFGGQQTAQPVPPATFRDYVLIDSVDPLIMESYPAQITLNVRGSHNGCEFPIQVDQQRDGSTVTVDIYREMSPDTVCPMVLIPYEDSIKLDGTFETGTYTIIVNGFELEVTI